MNVNASGVVGLTRQGRRQHRCRPIVYLANSGASVPLEPLVHLEGATPSELPRNYRLLEVDFPDNASVRDAPEQLDADWRQRLTPTLRIGNQGPASDPSLLLRMPSSVVGRTVNRLFNPAHPRATACRVVSVARFPLWAAGRQAGR